MHVFTHTSQIRLSHSFDDGFDEKINGKKDVLFFLEEGFINHHAYYQAHKNINWKNVGKANHH